MMTLLSENNQYHEQIVIFLSQRQNIFILEPEQRKLWYAHYTSFQFYYEKDF